MLFEGITKTVFQYIWKILFALVLVIVLILGIIVIRPLIWPATKTKSVAPQKSIQVIVNAPAEDQKKADKNLKVKQQVSVPLEDGVGELVGEVKTKITDQDGQVIGEFTEPTTFREDGGHLVGEIETSFSILAPLVPESRLKLLLGYNMAGIHPGIGIRITQVNFLGAWDIDGILTAAPEIGLGVSGQVKKYNWGALYFGAGTVYDIDPGGIKPLVYFGLSM